jgi:hypothetical protein
VCGNFGARIPVGTCAVQEENRTLSARTLRWVRARSE